MKEQEAKAALRAMGIISPARSLIAAYLKSQQAEEQELIPEAQGENPAERIPVLRSSKSLLEPVLRQTRTLERPSGRRKPGRPRIIANWFQAVAQTMADGTSLRTALRINGLSLSKSEIRACYRNVTLRALYTEARHRYFLEHGYGKKPSLRALVGRYV